MSDRVTDTRLYAALARLVAAGFAVDVDTDRQRLKVTPSRLLTMAQCDWVKVNLSALVLAVSIPVERWCIEYPCSRITADGRTAARHSPDKTSCGTIAPGRRKPARTTGEALELLVPREETNKIYSEWRRYSANVA